MVGSHDESERVETSLRKEMPCPHFTDADIVAEDERDMNGLLKNSRADAYRDTGKACSHNLLQCARSARDRDDKACDTVRDGRRDGFAGQLVLGRDHAKIPPVLPAQIAEDAREDFTSRIAEDGEGRDDIAWLLLDALMYNAGTALRHNEERPTAP